MNDNIDIIKQTLLTECNISVLIYQSHLHKLIQVGGKALQPKIINGKCEYFDPTKNPYVPVNYIVVIIF